MSFKKNILYGPPISGRRISAASLGELLLTQLISHNYEISQINAHTGNQQTFKEIMNDSCKLSIYLRESGITMNDRIAICSENCNEFCIPVCAALYMGATVCPLNPLYSKRELKHALNISKPKYIFTSPVAVKALMEIENQLLWRPKIILLYEHLEIPLQSIKNLTVLINDDKVKTFKPCKVNIHNHVAAILCSSGTTGLLKGVMLTDKNFFSVLQYLTDPDVGFVYKGAITLALLPYFHAYSFVVLIARLIAGATSILLSKFDEKVFLSTIERYKIEHLTVVPPLMVFLAKHPLVDKYNLSSIKTIWCGAAPLSQDLQEAVAKRLKVFDIRQGYGLTETTLAVLRTPSDCNKFGSAGVLNSGVSAKVIPVDDLNAEALGPYCKGELCFKGDMIMKGYCDDEKSTRATIDKDGWLHTGDLGYYDEDHHFFIVDRLKELIKYKGFQVPPAELEAELLTCPGIKDVAVIGVPNEEAGELPMAFVVKQDNCNITVDEIHKFINDRVSSHKRLRGGIRFINTIPKTPSGKILRRELRDMIKSKL